MSPIDDAGGGSVRGGRGTDDITDEAGGDRVSGSAGDDLIDITNGGEDFVNSGAGIAEARLDPGVQ